MARKSVTVEATRTGDLGPVNFLRIVYTDGYVHYGISGNGMLFLSSDYLRASLFWMA
jgi:hypothetical protein